MTTDKQQAYQLLDRLDAGQLAAVLHLLEVMTLPANKSATPPIIPFEDEEISDQEHQAVAASKEWFQHNKGIPHEEILAEFGLTPADFPLKHDSEPHGQTR